ncbi:hypothetical protein C8R44DRAFT_727128 [Mycena epipterygia]|nr:hypothetical protein C8R44DRAFT_727128 [Mycena epipterygia]
MACSNDPLEQTGNTVLEAGLALIVQDGHASSERVTTRGLATVVLWLSAITFLTNKDCETVYTALHADRLYQPTMDIEHMWHAYKEVCEILSDGSLDPVLQIVVPGILIPDVDLEDME